jgi:DNA-binding NarL/FixJ family response regulator
MFWDPVRPGPTSPPGPSQSVRIRPGYPKRSPVNDRDLQVLRGISDGKSNGCIGREMFLSENTIKSHAHHLFEKLGARDRAHAVMIALRLELIS